MKDVYNDNLELDVGLGNVGQSMKCDYQLCISVV